MSRNFNIKRELFLRKGLDVGLRYVSAPRDVELEYDIVSALLSHVYVGGFGSQRSLPFGSNSCFVIHSSLLLCRLLLFPSLLLVAVIKPLLAAAKTESKGTILMATVKGDLHDIGKNLVIMMLEGAGFNVIDLGVDLSVEKAVDKVEELKPHILGLSALLTTTMQEMHKVIALLEDKGLRKDIKVLVGGAPVDPNFAAKIGADGYGKDAAEAVQLARRLMCKK